MRVVAGMARSYAELLQFQQAANCPSFDSPQAGQRQSSAGLSSLAAPLIS
jgi:hypothetical protein